MSADSLEIPINIVVIVCMEDQRSIFVPGAFNKLASLEQLAGPRRPSDHNDAFFFKRGMDFVEKTVRLKESWVEEGIDGTGTGCLPATSGDNSAFWSTGNWLSFRLGSPFSAPLGAVGLTLNEFLSESIGVVEVIGEKG